MKKTQNGIGLEAANTRQIQELTKNYDCYGLENFPEDDYQVFVDEDDDLDYWDD
jgi:hypothetical protein